jgi:hypothetical protein
MHRPTPPSDVNTRLPVSVALLVTLVVMLAAPAVAVACPCAAVGHAMLWRREHPPHPSTTRGGARSSSARDPGVLLMAGFAPVALTALLIRVYARRAQPNRYTLSYTRLATRHLENRKELT